MEEKLVKLIIVAREFSEKSKKYYAEISFDGYFGQINISIRNKKHEYVETREIILKNVEKTKLNEVIEFIKNYEVQQ